MSDKAALSSSSSSLSFPGVPAFSPAFVFDCLGHFVGEVHFRDALDCMDFLYYLESNCVARSYCSETDSLVYYMGDGTKVVLFLSRGPLKRSPDLVDMNKEVMRP